MLVEQNKKTTVSRRLELHPKVLGSGYCLFSSKFYQKEKYSTDIHKKLYKKEISSIYITKSSQKIIITFSKMNLKIEQN